MPILEEKREILQDINKMTVFDYLIFKIAGQKGQQTVEAFLYVGHTHEEIDTGFSKIADQLRRNKATKIPIMLSLIPHSRQLKGSYDIKNWLSPCLNSAY